MKLDDAITEAATTVSGCFLCARKKIQYLGMFVPDNPAQWLGGQKPVPVDKTRGIFYGVCRKCIKRPDIAEAVEKRMQLQ